jgi:hypothetical protein
MDKLPKVFVNKIEKDFNNSQSSTIVDDRSVSLDDIFDNNKYSFNHKYAIELKNGKIYRTSIITNYGTKILTIDNDLININDIKSINEIKK